MNKSSVFKLIFAMAVLTNNAFCMEEQSDNFLMIQHDRNKISVTDDGNGASNVEPQTVYLNLRNGYDFKKFNKRRADASMEALLDLLNFSCLGEEADEQPEMDLRLQLCSADIHTTVLPFEEQ